MLTSWLTITVSLAASASPCRAAAGHSPLTVAPTCRVKGHPEALLTLNCGDGKRAGVVQYWHTPFGDLHTQRSHTELDPVFMHHDGSLVVPSSSALHSGLYYCLLLHAEGTTLWPYELHISYDDPDGYEQGNGCHVVRLRRDAEESEEQAGVSDEQFAGAVAASVLLTFVLGFSAGALSRNHVLRCLGSLMTRVQAARRRRHTDTPDHASDASMTTEPHMYMGTITVETPNSSTSTSPPEKPKRSFRHKREEQQETSAYMEGCDHREEDRRHEKEMRNNCDGKTVEEEEQEEEREVIGFYLFPDGGGQTKAQDTGDRREKKAGREEEEEAGERREDGEDRRAERTGSKQLTGGNRNKKGETEEKEGGDGETERQDDIYRDSQPSSTDTEDEETACNRPEETLRDDITGGRGASPSPRRRVIRLYQYDEDGQRYSHLPDPSPDDPGPAPRLKQRSLSLTRLNAIMAAASAGPLDERETKGEDGEERPRFHMEI